MLAENDRLPGTATQDLRVLTTRGTEEMERELAAKAAAAAEKVMHFPAAAAGGVGDAGNGALGLAAVGALRVDASGPSSQLGGGHARLSGARAQPAPLVQPAVPVRRPGQGGAKAFQYVVSPFRS
ncbi:hypothetical protein COCSUDRAFT_61208 [Coccomyxa subellipsoidea C-169]|uniref:Uncharacterized protein n=1 Tax=Coccomyxa subellipsoidea (strain C-169) TaxID=574566 RepID=I0Z6F8_COCSC|nr:hypothetical protein COCSUDRAFT_61208 [Coccomyxa subellipsoidea C-169]EIE26227.1 hypothetical protein COCSUDRAFT_61208 [Coccomyxa subellipsoidea C-169]|eukprot:XP_005650771.1 hypothetical protein COCSUDRAFT_61208 [Coccomyxa subellipsoidea C-169]